MRTVQKYKIRCAGSNPDGGVMRIEARSRESLRNTIKMNSSRNP